MEVLGIIDEHLQDDDVALLWSHSGCRWLTHPNIPVPGALVRRVVGLVRELDERGSELAELVPGRGLGLLAERAATMGLPPSDRVSAGGAARLIKCTDGWIGLSLARDDDLDLLPALVEHDVDDLRHPWDIVEQWAQLHTAVDIRDRSVLLGLPCSPVGEVTDGRPAIAHRVGGAASTPLIGATVVNLAALWAGPLCADILGRLGARVITVESTQRPDGGRRARRFFEALHGRSDSVALDLTSASGRRALIGLLEAADVVIEGSRPRAMENFGVDARNLAATGPRVWISITAHGRSEPHRHRVGFGDDAAAGGGLVGWVSGTPVFIADAVADPVTGLTAALAAAQLLERGGRWVVDVALARVVASTAGGWVETSDIAPIERPRPRRDPGASMPLGRDTARVLQEFGLV